MERIRTAPLASIVAFRPKDSIALHLAFSVILAFSPGNLWSLVYSGHFRSILDKMRHFVDVSKAPSPIHANFRGRGRELCTQSKNCQ